MLFSVLIRKNQVPRHNFHPFEIQILVKQEEADLSWWLPQGQVPRPCPTVISEGANALDPPGPSGPQATQELTPPQIGPMQTTTAISWHRQG